MKSFSQSCLALPESPKLRAKQGHAKSATFAKVRSDLNNNPFRLYPESVGALRPLREPSAFSLTEVVIAMGVAAVAFTSIIGLFPLGLNMSKESYEETQAALLAQTILCDLRDQLTGLTGISGRLVQIGEENSPLSFNTTLNYTIIDTSLTRDAPQTLYIAYDQKSRTKDTLYGELMLRPFASSSSEPSWYSLGTNQAIALAKISVSATFRLDTSGTGNPQRVDVAIETPGNLPAAKRKQFLFSGGVAP
jgi:hypothetical protein